MVRIIGVAWNLKRSLAMVTTHILFATNAMIVWRLPTHQRRQQRQHRSVHLTGSPTVVSKSNHRIHPKQITEILSASLRNWTPRRAEIPALSMWYDTSKRNSSHHRQRHYALHHLLSNNRCNPMAISHPVARVRMKSRPSSILFLSLARALFHRLPKTRFNWAKSNMPYEHQLTPDYMFFDGSNL